jgi:hypothetical protein
MPSIQVIVGATLMLVALAAGALGTWHNIRSAQGPRERRLVIRSSLALWLLVGSMLAVVYVAPTKYRFAVLLVYFIVCPILLYRWTLMHQLARLADQRDSDEAK